ncbi:MAG: GTPase Era [Holosporaceae bacterium]|nr:GTPase Era [Holosporaceae bacterium]
MKKCGFIAVLGETNAGKSMLINKLVGQKVSIVSRKIQTTLFRILGIAIKDESQIIFIDTPGFSSKAKNLEQTTWNAFRESEQILFVIDGSKKKFDLSVEMLKKIHADKKISLAINKVDLIHKPMLLETAAIFNKIRSFENIFMVSALTGSGVEDIKKYFASSMPENEWLYDENEITDLSFEKYAAEITREHVYHRIHEEIPYQCTIETVDCQNQSDGSMRIEQNIYVKSIPHKTIFVGHDGQKIKSIGEAARKELSFLLEKKVHLFLRVLVNR